MTISYVILAHSNLMHIDRMINALDSQNINFFIHIDKKCNEDFSFLKKYDNVTIVYPRLSVEWGGFSIIETVIECIRQAMSIQCDYIILLSGTDYPLKNNDYIFNYLQNNSDKDFIEGTPIPSKECHWLEGGRRRIECYALKLGCKEIATVEPRKFNKGNIRQFGKILLNSPQNLPLALDILINYPLRRHPNNLIPYRGEMWWNLRQSTAQTIIKYLDNHRDFIEYHKSTCIPDEIFFSTLVYNLIPRNQIVNDCLRFINWGIGIPGKSPKEASIKDKDMIDNAIDCSNYLFGRKITDTDTINYINRQLI